MSGILTELQEAGARVKYNVDATCLRKGLKVHIPAITSGRQRLCASSLISAPMLATLPLC